MVCDIAAVIIGRNEQRRLGACLASVQSYVSLVIYVDSGSTDSSVQIAERLGAEVILLRSGPYTAARARNEGLSAVRTKRPDIPLVQFVDGDCTLDVGWISSAAQFLREHRDVAVVCGRRRELNPGASIYNRICDQEWNTAIGQTLSCGGDSMIRVEAFEAVGGFSAGLIAGEEPELCLRLREKGWKIWRLDAEMTVHDIAMTRFSQWWRRAARFGYGTAELSLLHWKSSSDTWRRQLASSIVWGGAIPLGICVTSVLSPVILAASIIYPIQVCRIALARRSSPNSWEYAVLVMLAKFAEFSGLMKFAWRKLVRKPNQLIEYK